MKDIAKLSIKKEDVQEIIKQKNFFKLSEDGETAILEIKNNFNIISVLNIPQNYSTEDIVKEFNLNPNIKILKRSLFWHLSGEFTKEELNELFVKISKCSFQTENKIKHDLVTKTQIIQNILRQIHLNIYQKETSDLKGKNSEKSTNGNANQKTKEKTNPNISGSKSNNSNEAFSWRKKSNDQSSNGNNGSDTKSKDQEKKNYQNYKDNTNNKSNNNFKRERFNSEGNATSKFSQNANYNSNLNNGTKLEEIEIDMSNIKYTLNIKYKYSTQEMVNHLAKLVSLNKLSSTPFSNSLEEIVLEKRKEVNILCKRDRSNTSYDTEIPTFKTKDNRESFSNNYQQSSYYSQNQNQNNNSNKIPKNNPLGSLGNFNNFCLPQFNKFDDQNLFNQNGAENDAENLK